MIKETDASKNDECRVKNKLNLLTHKRKGETRTMYNQSTKHWKLGALLVVGLVLMAGLFVNGVLAHDIDDPGIAGQEINGPVGNVKVSAVRSGFVEDTSITLRVVYAATEVLADPDPGRDGDTTDDATYGRIRVTLPANWGPATGDIVLTDEDPTVPYVQVRTSRTVVLDPNADEDDDSETGAAGLTITGSTGGGWTVNIDVNHMVRGNTVTLDFHNLDLPRNEREEDNVTEASVQVTVVSDGQDNSDAARDIGTPTHAPTIFSPKVAFDNIASPSVGSDTQPTIKVLEKKLGEVSITSSVPESTPVDLVIRYTATADLANLGNPDAFPVIAPTYGRIKVILPDGWGPETDLSVKRSGSRGVIFSSDDSDDLTPTMEEDRWRIDVDVDHMEDNDRVTITFPKLMIPMIDRPDLPSATELKDLGTIYINTADRVSDIGDLENENYVLSKFSPKVAYDATTMTGQDYHPTITVKEQRLGKITVGPGSGHCGYHGRLDRQVRGHLGPSGTRSQGYRD